MPATDTSLGGEGRDFPSTAWNQIGAAVLGDDGERRACFERLVRIYWKPVYYFVRAVRGGPVEDAKDVTQAFFAKLLEKGSLERLREERGSFRGFLKRSVRNFVVDVARREAVRRPPDGLLLPFEECRDEEMTLEGGPEEVFDREWGRTVLYAGLSELESGLEKSGLRGYFEVFRAYCLSETGGRTYQEVAEALGITESAVRKRLVRCRRDLRRILRRMVSEYVGGEEDVETEFAEIMKG